jgi:hypothetical protein
MKIVKRILSIVSWIIVVFLQWAIGFSAGTIAFIKSHANIIYMWVGMTFGVFVIGVVNIMLRRAVARKMYFSRLGFTGLGAAIFSFVFYKFDFQYEWTYQYLSNIPLLVPVTGIIGFYILDLFRKESCFKRWITQTGYGISILIMIVGAYILWDWLTPFPPPPLFQNAHHVDALNIEMVKDVGSKYELAIDEPDIFISTDGTQGIIESVPNSLYLLDFSDPVLPSIQNILHESYSIFHFDQRIAYAYVSVTTRPTYYMALDISNPNQPTVIWQQDWNKEHGQPFEMIVNGTLSYNFTETDGCYIYDISNPANPTLINHQVGIRGIDDLNDYAFKGDYLYIIDGLEIRILNIANPKAVAEVGVYKSSTSNVGDRIRIIDDLFIGSTA